MAMTYIVNMHEAKSTLSSLVAKAREGDDIIIARAGKPVAKIVPYDLPANPQRIGGMKGRFKEFSEEEWAETDRAIAHLWDL
ncbi:MAG: hypothetical protein RL247_924 [Actinomycetota bacterium]